MSRSYAITLGVVRVATNTVVLTLPGLLISPVGAVVFFFVGVACGIVHAHAIESTESYEADAHGIWLFVVDHTWSLPNTVVGSLFLALNLLFGNERDKAHSKHRSTVVLHNGVFSGFATTIGNVEAGTFTHNVDAHEYTHVLQARIFGPAYIPLVLLNYVVGTILPYWLVYHDHSGKPIRSLKDYLMCGVYPHTWHEEWAYSIQGSPKC